MTESKTIFFKDPYWWFPELELQQVWYWLLCVFSSMMVDLGLTGMRENLFEGYFQVFVAASLLFIFLFAMIYGLFQLNGFLWVWCAIFLTGMLYDSASYAPVLGRVLGYYFILYVIIEVYRIVVAIKKKVVS